MPAVNGEEEGRTHRGMSGVEGGDAGENGADVIFCGQVGEGDGARGGAELEVDDAVGVEGLEDRSGGVGEGGDIIAEGVDVLGEEGEEADRVDENAVERNACNDNSKNSKQTGKEMMDPRL